MSIPNKLVYDIQSPQADGSMGCREKDNSRWNCKPRATDFNP